MIPEEWLKIEDEKCYQERLDRLKWLIDISPSRDIWLFHGGLLPNYLFEEARYCFVYGQYISTVVLGFSFIEYSLTSIFYGAGQDRIEHAKSENIFQEALRQGIIDHNEFHSLDHIRKLRNPFVHFRRPGVKESIEYAWVIENDIPNAKLEQDAQFVIGIVMRLLGKFSENI
jgi:hypothetical protein